MVCRASGNYGVPFKAGRGMTQGGPQSAKLFNLLVDTVTQEWIVWLLLEGVNDHLEQDLAKLMQGFLEISTLMMPTLCHETRYSYRRPSVSWSNLLSTLA
jgi:hypothetical protein